ncbi:MAG: IS5 family transposase [Clostridia bacterium]|nr:IS5 family transposase [Clostridia bacterium]
MEQLSIFSSAKREVKLSALGDNLEKLNEVINWEIFRPMLVKAVTVENPKGPGGRRRYDVVMMFKILVLARLFNLSDDQAEYQINDRISFMRFLGLGLNNTVPDAKTIWLFRETLKNAGIMDDLFARFNGLLKQEGLITREGTIVDATFVEVPKQRNHREENEAIKAGKVPEDWQKPENKHKLAQKDTDARWARKNNQTYFGYKDHVKADAKSKLITNYSVTAASVNDNQEFIGLLDGQDKVIYADSGYVGRKYAEQLPEGAVNKIHEKAEKNRPLTEEQKKSNRDKSRTRCRIEHIFGYMTGAMHGIIIRSIGLARAKFNIGMMNLVYNLCRYTFLMRSRKTQAAKG